MLQGLASREALVGVVGHGEKGFGGALHCVVTVLLVVLTRT